MPPARVCLQYRRLSTTEQPLLASTPPIMLEAGDRLHPSRLGQDIFRASIVESFVVLTRVYQQYFALGPQQMLQQKREELSGRAVLEIVFVRMRVLKVVVTARFRTHAVVATRKLDVAHFLQLVDVDVSGFDRCRTMLIR